MCCSLQSMQFIANSLLIHCKLWKVCRITSFFCPLSRVSLAGALHAPSSAPSMWALRWKFWNSCTHRLASSGLFGSMFEHMAPPWCGKDNEAAAVEIWTHDIHNKNTAISIVHGHVVRNWWRMRFTLKTPITETFAVTQPYYSQQRESHNRKVITTGIWLFPVQIIVNDATPAV